MAPPERAPIVGIVGPCSAGKSTLTRALTEAGVRAKSIGQEHSYVPHMWQVIGQPDVLVYLDVSYPVAQGRRWLNWVPADLEEQRRRLRHAREHCHFYVHTDPLTAEQVRDQVLDFLRQPR
jgi:hypothetical protein